MTRAVKNLYVIESNKKHTLLELLGLTNFSAQLNTKAQTSTIDEWQKEARRLEMQGKKEQAEAIRNEILQIKPVPWEIVSRTNLKEIIAKATDEKNFNKKAKDSLFEYALFYGETNYFKKLASLKYGAATDGRWQKERQGFLNRKFQTYKQDEFKLLQPLIQRHGVDFRNEFNLTPFMLAVNYGAEKILTQLIEIGANVSLTDNYGNNALHLLLAQCFIDAAFKKRLNRFYHFLKNESLKLKIGTRFFKIESHQAEFLMLSFMLASMKNLLLFNKNEKYDFTNLRGHFESIDFVYIFEGLNHQVLPEYRTKRAYISSILAKNEVLSDNKYNKQLFVRISNGKYIINPQIELMVEGKWVNFYDLIDI